MTTLKHVLGPAAQFRHDHPPVRSVNEEAAKVMTFGERVADKVAVSVGSWPFIIMQSVLLAFWIGFNVYLAVMEHTHPGYLKAWDPYPFILLNLMLSFQAAYTGPVVMMSQNRQSLKDRLVAQSDYEVNQKAEEEIEVIMRHLVHQDKLLLDAIARIESLKLTSETDPMTGKVDELLKRLDQNDKTLLELLSRVQS
jgi:uncharacterized membrane protein